MKNIRFLILFSLLILVALYIDVSDVAKLNLSVGKYKIPQFTTQLGLDLKGGSHLVFEADMKDIASADRKDAIESARNIIERRVNFFGVSEPSVQTTQVGDKHRIIVDLPGSDDTSKAISLIGQTARLEFTKEPPEGTKFASDTPDFLKVNEQTGITGKHIQRSDVQTDDTGRPAVGLTFNSEGTKLFAELTKQNVGKRIGIFVDGFPITNPPTVNQPILDGKGIISGSFSIEEAKQLSIAINSGALPVSIKLVEQRSIGPSLGADHIRKSLTAGIVGLAAVILFMLMYYGRLGIIAAVGLMLYGLVTFAIFKLFSLVLTLPGIAGFILSIGMAVDSNILIFERIKEEVRKGKDVKGAVRVGFGRAIDAIKDANVTTILVALILYNPLNASWLPQFGLIRGFALTLLIGVVVSLFTGVFVTKRLLEIFYLPKGERKIKS